MERLHKYCPTAFRWERTPLAIAQGKNCYCSTRAAPLCFLLLTPHPHFFLWTNHFPFGTEEGMALQVLIELVLGNVGKHFIVDLVCRAVGYPERQNETSCLGHCTHRPTNPSSNLPANSCTVSSSIRATQRRQRECRSTTQLQYKAQHRGRNAAGLSARETQSSCWPLRSQPQHSSARTMCITQRQERRENISPCGRRTGSRRQESTAAWQSGNTSNALPQRDSGRSSLEYKVTRGNRKTCFLNL